MATLQRIEADRRLAFTVEEFAGLISVNPQTVYDQLEDRPGGWIPVIRVGRAVRIPKARAIYALNKMERRNGKPVRES